MRVKQAILLSLSLFLNSCAAMPKWNGHLWAGSADLAGVKRAQDGAFISCNQQDFSEMVCMSYDDFSSFYQTYILGCQVWRPSGK